MQFYVHLRPEVKHGVSVYAGVIVIFADLFGNKSEVV